MKKITLLFLSILMTFMANSQTDVTIDADCLGSPQVHTFNSSMSTSTGKNAYDYNGFCFVSWDSGDGQWEWGCPGVGGPVDEYINTTNTPVNPPCSANFPWTLNSVFFCSSAFTLTGDCESVVLPIELAAFSAKVEGEKVLVTWETLSEENNALFEIERSINGQDFEVIGTVEGAGTSLIPLNYQFTDENPVNGISYYRLRQTDFDGTSETFQMSAVSMNGYDKKIRLFPTTPTTTFNIEFSDISDKDIIAQIFNINGQHLNSFNIPAGNFNYQVDVSNLTMGTYILKLDIEGKQVTKKFIKY